MEKVLAPQEWLRLENLVIQRLIIREAQKIFAGQNFSHAAMLHDQTS